MAALEASGIGGLRQRWLNRRHPRQGASSVSRLRASGHPREEDYEDVQDVLAAEPVEAELQKAKVPPTTHFFITHARNPEQLHADEVMIDSSSEKNKSCFSSPLADFQPKAYAMYKASCSLSPTSVFRIIAFNT